VIVGETEICNFRSKTFQNQKANWSLKKNQISDKVILTSKHSKILLYWPALMIVMNDQQHWSRLNLKEKLVRKTCGSLVFDSLHSIINKRNSIQINNQSLNRHFTTTFQKNTCWISTKIQCWSLNSWTSFSISWTNKKKCKNIEIIHQHFSLSCNNHTYLSKWFKQLQNFSFCLITLKSKK
jgi:hypothetical protein